MPAFPLIKNPAGYRPCADDMLIDIPYRDHWLAHFTSHFEIVVQLAIDNYGPAFAANAHACRDELRAALDAIKLHPRSWGELNLLVLDLIRQQKLHAFDIPDPFQKMKRRENDRSLALYPLVIAELDAHAADADRLLLLIEGIFAGNIFDLGAGATAQRFATESVDFLQVRDSIGGTRPWLIDQYAPFARRILNGPPHKTAIFFADNAGADIILGVLPFARWMAARGTTMVIAANRLPALNDITFRELRPLAAAIARVDPLFARLLDGGQIRIVDSGGVAPLIDLRHLSEAVCAEAADADLLFLEGMGRGLETNFHAAFTVDAVKLCMIKQQLVAERHGGKLFDTVFRYDAR
jgi:type II pantothenate kinase